MNGPTHSDHAVVAQDGLRDFALADNSAPGSTTYCVRAVKSDGAALTTYTVYPEVTTAAGAGGSRIPRHSGSGSSPAIY